MNRNEAAALLETHLVGMRTRGYVELAALRGESMVAELRGASGTAYQVEVEIVWNGLPGGDLRIIGSIDDGGLGAVVPLTADILVSPPN